MKIKLLLNFTVFCMIMLVSQIIILVLTFAMGMGDYNSPGGLGNLFYVILRYVFGFPLYLFFDFDRLINNSEFKNELIILFFANTIIQFLLFRFLKNKVFRKAN
jgi:hypothetical protein